MRLLYFTMSMPPIYHALQQNMQPHKHTIIRAPSQDAAEQDKHVVLAHTFIDSPYNRTGFTLASASEDKVQCGAWLGFVLMASTLNKQSNHAHAKARRLSGQRRVW